MSELVEQLRDRVPRRHQDKDLLVAAADRIEALEAALAQIAELTNASKNTTCSTCRKAGVVVARAALAPEQDR
jgi:hypothetical protein